MSKINIQGLINHIPSKTSIYSPIVEAIVNSIQAINETGRKDGEINIVLKRNAQLPLDADRESIPPVTDIEIYDNGSGFNTTNRNSFDTLYSDYKINIGGKGFGRCMFLKYFKNVRIDSIFLENGIYSHRTFNFTSNTTNVSSLISNENVVKSDQKELKTVVSLENIRSEHSKKMDIRIQTIARVLVEKLLPYFINEKIYCPKITLEDSKERIILNNFINDHDDIKLSATHTFTIKKDKNKKEFEVKVFKIRFASSSSCVLLTGHSRVVTSTPLHDYIPEFKDEFQDVKINDGKPVTYNYVIKAYVLGEYLDSNVNLERDDFFFPNEGVDLFLPINRKEIEQFTVNLVEKDFNEDMVSRKDSKYKKVKQYVEEKAPWHKPYFNELDLSKIPFNFDDETIESELLKLKIKWEAQVRGDVKDILKKSEKDIAAKVNDVMQKVTNIGMSELARYVSTRRVVLDILKKSLEWNDDKKHEKEKVLHDIIFPMKTDSDKIPYDKHNLWVIDERLSFTEYIQSDKKLKNGDRPDIAIFDKPIAIREGDQLHNPITIIEFKRPQRNEYDDDEDPLKQIGNYIRRIRSGEILDIKGRTINVNENTPAYGFLICDITPKIKDYAIAFDLIDSPDQSGYFGFHNKYQIYFEIISFDKLIKDSELRNKIFFDKLKIS